VGLAQQWDQLNQLGMRIRHNLEQQIQVLLSSKNTLFLFKYSNSSESQAVLRIRDVNPGFMIIIHPGSQIQQRQQKRRREKLFSYLFLCSHTSDKISNYFIFEPIERII
jgi:hypothetical protein